MAVERLLTDDSPQMEAVLEYLIYGRGGRENGVFEARRLIEVIEALKAGDVHVHSLAFMFISRKT